MTTETKVQRTKSGVVTSDKMDQTVTVMIERKIKHPLYGKYVKKSTKIHAHDPENKCQQGDFVKIAENAKKLHSLVQFATEGRKIGI